MDDIRVADGFDTNDLRLLARRAVAVKDALRSLNQAPPFNEPRLVAYLDLLEATPEPKDGELVLAAVLQARSVIRATHGENLGTGKEPEATTVDRELAALYGDLTIVLAPFANLTKDPEVDGPVVVVAGHEADVAAMQKTERNLRKDLQAAIREFLESPLRMGLTASVLANMVDPLVLAGFIALFIIARLSEGRISNRVVDSLLARQDEQVTAFAQAVEQNRTAIEAVAGLYDKVRETIASTRSKIATVRRGVSRLFGIGEPSSAADPPSQPATRRPDEPEPPSPSLPPPDCTTKDGQPGYLLAGTCYPLDTRELDLSGEQDIDLPKIAVFRQLTHLDLDNAAVHDLTPVAGLVSLKSLYLNETLVSDLTPVAGLTNLQMLILNRAPVSDLTPLAGLTSLRMLYLNDTKVSDLTPVTNLTSLEMLSLDNTPVSDLTPMSGLISLESLSFNNTPVSDLTPVANLTSLQSLSLSNTQVRDLTPVADLANLEVLSLNDTSISELGPVVDLANLEVLWLDGTGVSDLISLKQFENLHYLSLPDGVELGGVENNNKNRREVQNFLATL